MTNNSINFHSKIILNQGYTILKNVISEKECNKLKAKSKMLFSKYGKLYKGNKNEEKTIYNLHNKDPIFLKYLDHKAVLSILKIVLSKGSYNNRDHFILQQSAVRSPKKNFVQQLHNDTRLVGTRFPLVVQVVWMLDDFTKDNGATRIVPKSNRFNHFPINNKKYKNEKIITGSKGSVLIFDGSIWHGSSKNVTNIDRWGMIFRYARWYLKPSFDFNFNTPAKIYKRLNSFQKTLLGFKFSPPKDEFERMSARSKKPIKPKNYYLPK